MRSESGLYISGIILKKHRSPLAPEGTWWDTFRKTIRTYFTKAYRGPILIKGEKNQIEVQTDRRGGFEVFTEDLEMDHLRFELPHSETSIPILQSYPWKFNLESTSHLVISDMDDTILVSKSSEFFSKIWLMLFRQTSKRNFVEESEKAYRKLKDTGMPFCYVSASEENLFATIANFLSYHELPLGPLLLRPYTHWRDLLKKKRRSNYKVDRIGRLASLFPETQLILFGDDSQQDPEAFLKIAEMYPERVCKIFIRKTGAEKNVDFISSMRVNRKLAAEVYHYGEFTDIENQIQVITNEYLNGGQPDQRGKG